MTFFVFTNELADYWRGVKGAKVQQAYILDGSKTYKIEVKDDEYFEPKDPKYVELLLQERMFGETVLHRRLTVPPPLYTAIRVAENMFAAVDTGEGPAVPLARTRSVLTALFAPLREVTPMRIGIVRSKNQLASLLRFHERAGVEAATFFVSARRFETFGLSNALETLKK